MKVGDLEFTETTRSFIKEKVFKEGMSERSRISILSSNINEMKREGIYSKELIENLSKQLNELIDKVIIDEEKEGRINELLFKGSLNGFESWKQKAFKNGKDL